MADLEMCCVRIVTGQLAPRLWRRQLGVQCSWTLLLRAVPIDVSQVYKPLRGRGPEGRNLQAVRCWEGKVAAGLRIFRGCANDFNQTLTKTACWSDYRV